MNEWDDNESNNQGSLRETTDVWYEKYRPQNLDEMVLPLEVKEKIRDYLKDGGFGLPHLGLFSRTPGTGKSSLAKVILKEINAEALWINASMDKGIDILRTRIQRFAATKPLRDAVKVVVMDEFDSFSRAGQDAFRGFIDQFGENVRFIFTGNNKENIIEPLLDRMQIHDFNQFPKEEIVKPIFNRLVFILENEGIKYERADVAKIIKQDFPRIRRMIVSMRKCVNNGVLDFQAFGDTSALEKLAALIKSKNYQEAIKMVYSLGTVDHLFGYFGSNLELICNKPEAEINAIIILAKYQHMSATVKDVHLNAAACICELMKL